MNEDVFHAIIRPRLPSVIAMLCFCCTMSSQSSWEVSKIEDDITVYTKDTEDSSFKSFKVETTFKAKLETVLATLLDVQNIPTYYDMIVDVQDIKEITSKEATYTLFFDFPWPVKDRFCHVESNIELNEDGSVAIHTTSVDGDDKPKFIQAEAMKSIWRLKRGKDDTTKIMHSGFLDPSGNLPAWLTTKQTTESPFRSIQRMRDRFKYYEGSQIPFLE